MICLISMGQISGLGRGDNRVNKSLYVSAELLVPISQADFKETAQMHVASLSL